MQLHDDRIPNLALATLSFAKEHGANWKDRLAISWSFGQVTGPLYQARNLLGPQWLESLPESVDELEKIAQIAQNEVEAHMGPGFFEGERAGDPMAEFLSEAREADEEREERVLIAKAEALGDACGRVQAALVAVHTNGGEHRRKALDELREALEDRKERIDLAEQGQRGHCEPTIQNLHPWVGADLDRETWVAYSDLRESGDLETQDFEEVYLVCPKANEKGSSTQKANYAIMAEFSDTCDVVCPGVGQSGYGAVTWRAIRLDAPLESLRAFVEALESLADYPCLDDERAEEIALEEQGKAWAEWACSHFMAELEHAEDLDLSEVREETLLELFDTLRDRECVHWEEGQEGGAGWYIKVGRVAKGISREQVEQLIEAGAKVGA